MRRGPASRRDARGAQLRRLRRALRGRCARRDEVKPRHAFDRACSGQRPIVELRAHESERRTPGRGEAAPPSRRAYLLNTSSAGGGAARRTLPVLRSAVSARFTTILSAAAPVAQPRAPAHSACSCRPKEGVVHGAHRTRSHVGRQIASGTPQTRTPTDPAPAAGKRRNDLGRRSRSLGRKQRHLVPACPQPARQQINDQFDAAISLRRHRNPRRRDLCDPHTHPPQTRLTGTSGVEDVGGEQVAKRAPRRQARGPSPTPLAPQSARQATTTV